MSHDPHSNPKSNPDIGDESASSTASDDLYAENEAGKPRMVDRFGRTGSPAEREDEFSVVDPLLYAPLLLVGALLVVFPEPATSVIGLFCIAVGIFLAVVDLLSPSDESRTGPLREE
jgi:hypothetical protein